MPFSLAKAGAFARNSTSVECLEDALQYLLRYQLCILWVLIAVTCINTDKRKVTCTVMTIP